MDIAANTTENIDRTVSGLRDGVSTATANLQQAQSAMSDGLKKMMTTAQDMLSFSQGNIEAVGRSSQILMSGMQDIGQSMAAAAKSSMDDTMGSFKALSGVRSFKDLFELQSNMVRSAMERSVAQTGHLTESTLKLSERAFAPIGARLSAATDKFGRLS